MMTWISQNFCNLQTRFSIYVCMIHLK